MDLMSESIDQLAIALCEAQSEMRHAKKDSQNPFFKSKYADLTSIVEAVKEVSHKNGLSYSQIGIPSDGAGVRTILMHKSGQWLASDVCVKPVKEDPQSFGSAMTYARRYGLQAIYGLSAEEDDDGNAASRSTPPKPSAKKPAAKKQAPKKPWTKEQNEKLRERAASLNMTPQDIAIFKGWVCTRLDAPIWDDIPSMGKASFVINQFAELYDEWKTAA